MRVLLVTMYFPPAGGGGVARPLKLATHLPELGIETHVLAPDDPKWVARDDELDIPQQAHVHRARYIGPRGRLPAEELHGLEGADRRDSVAANPDRRVDKLSVRVKERGQALVARLVAKHADAVITVSDAISQELRDLGAARVETIPNGCDFDDFEGLEYVRGGRFRITHTGSFFGHRDPKPFLTALAESAGDVVARFVVGR